jgi:carbon monoxide dehydrogenase subunit G
LRLEKQFDVDRSRDEAVECVVQDATLIELFPDSETEIVESLGDRRTVRSHYRALGREGTATFHFDFLLDGGVRFEKVCDGKVWRRLVGQVSFEERGERTRVRIELDGQTRPLVPEFTIKGAMRDQLEQMARALRQRIESA